MTATQPPLIAGYYRCHNCGRDVAAVRKERRFRLCDDCWQQIVAPARAVEGLYDDEFRAVRGAFWSWYHRMEQRYPTPTHSHAPKVSRQITRLADSWYPICECGRPRTAVGLRTGTAGLFGGPFMQYCDVCDAKRNVESIVALADRIAPGRDDEEWLDLLYQSHRTAFDCGVLPGYWFELRQREM